MSYPELPKWPGLLVVGEKVTAEQASVILVRTNLRYLFSNDKVWLREVRQIMGFDPDEYAKDSWRRDQNAAAALGMLDLEYLANSRIASSWIGGPHGWCDWDGTIGAASYNIGKWPSVEAVRNEWTLIAAAFSFLSLRCQILDTEIGEGGSPVVEFTVSGGEVSVSEPGDLVTSVRDLSPAQVLAQMLGGSERGCTAEVLRNAVALCVEAVR